MGMMSVISTSVIMLVWHSVLIFPFEQTIINSQTLT